jgi:tetratricopeptide (TPR) repeat protein
MTKNKLDSADAPPPKSVEPRAGGLIGGLRVSLGQLVADQFRLLLLLVMNLAVVVGIVSTAVILRNRKPPPKPITLTAALAALDQGHTADARRMAERLTGNKDITTEDWGGPDFILGTVTARAADEAGGKQRAESFRLASLYLARSRVRGFPPNREPAGLYLLGKSLCYCGRLDEALPVLEQAQECGGEHANEIGLLLIEACLGIQPPELDKALAGSQRLLSKGQLTDAQRPKVFMRQALALLRMDRLKECAAALGQVSDDPLLRGEVLLLRGWLAMKEGAAIKKTAAGTREAPRDAQDKFRQATDLLRRAQGQDPGDNHVARQAAYLMGLCLLERGELPSALNQMERTSRIFRDSPEYVAALYQQADIAHRIGRHAESVSAYRRLASAYAQQGDFQNPWITAAQAKTAILDKCQEYFRAEKYETAILLSKSLAHLTPKAEALQLTASIYRAWGDNLLEQADRLPPQQADDLRKQGRTQLRRAGDSFAELARQQYTTRQYPEQLWKSADCYFAGHDFRGAAAVLRLYLHNENRLRHAQALVDLGEAQLSMGDTRNALQSFYDCIQQHPRDVAIYRARLLASRTAVELGDLKQAEAFLQDNLSGEQLTPASKEWRDSLFALAELLHHTQRDRDAIQRLEEALQRYPDAPQATAARYLLADSSRRLAMNLRADLGKEISSALRGQRSVESNRLLKQAMENYMFLRENLGRRDAESLTEKDKALLRNSRFAVGVVCCELERYPEALRAFQSVANHNATSPEVLDAYLQIANVYRRMSRPAEARTSLEQARLALRRIPPEVRCEQTTNYSREQWSNLLDSLCSL